MTCINATNDGIMLRKCKASSEFLNSKKGTFINFYKVTMLPLNSLFVLWSILAQNPLAITYL